MNLWAILSSKSSIWFDYLEDVHLQVLHRILSKLWCSSFVQFSTSSKLCRLWEIGWIFRLIFFFLLVCDCQIVHHLMSIISLILAVHAGHAHLYLYIVLLSECTTPFINLRWYFHLSLLLSYDLHTLTSVHVCVALAGL